MIAYGEFQQLCKESDKEAAQWYENHLNDIRQNILGKISSIINNGKYVEPSGPKAVYCSAVQDTYTQDSQLRLSDIIYCSGRFDKQSCHKIIFGKSKKVSPPAYLEIMLQELDLLPYDKLQDLISFLKRNHLATSNPDAIMQMRFTELADSAGADMVEFLPKKTHNSFNVISRFARANPSPKASVRFLTFQSSDNALYIILYLCSKFDLSADYLLMQDYSEIACSSEGKDITQLQKLFLSAYLNANRAAQEEVIRQIGYMRLGIHIVLPEA